MRSVRLVERESLRHLLVQVLVPPLRCFEHPLAGLKKDINRNELISFSR
jgi:hypothetical protein